MGAFFTNVQVYAPSGREEETRAAIVRALADEARAGGYVAAAEGEEADRSILVGPAGRWIAVYDEATESQDLAPLDALARALSRVAHDAAVAVLVHDGDVLLLHLFHDGELADVFDSAPAYFAKAPASRKKQLEGKPERWARLLADGRTDDLRAAFDAGDLAAEATLDRVARLLGIDPRAASTGYQYLDEDEADAPGTTKLRFRLVARPAFEAPATGPVRFAAAAHSPGVELAVGAPMHVAAAVRNEGGAGRGLTVVVWGDAVDRGLVLPERAQVVVGAAEAANVVEVAFERRAAKSGGAAFVAPFPELAIPAGNAGGLGALQGASMQKMFDRMYASNVHCNVKGQVLAPGAARLFVGFRGEGGAEHGYAIEVVSAPAPRKPLRGAAQAHDYVTLETPDVLVAMAMSTLGSEETAAIAAEAIERWSEAWPREGKLACVLHDGAEGGAAKKPRTANVRLAAGLTSGRGWKRVRAALATARQVNAQRWKSDEPGPDAHVVDGFEHGGTLFVPRDAADPELPTLRLTVDLRGRDGAAALLERARAEVDDFVRRTRAAQAFVARWKWNAGFSVDATAYERASGVHGTCTLRRSWATRFLRAVSADGVWLGPALAARVPDRAALDAVATIEPVGEALRVVLRPGASLDALEAALAPLLPSADDHRRALEHLYGR